MNIHTKLSDLELIDQLRRGNEAAFAEIYDRYWEKIFMLASNALNSPEEAEECVQDIFCSIWLRRETLQLKYSFYTYLAVAVKYKVINILDKEYRKRQRMNLLTSDYFDQYAPSAEIPLLEKELLEKLQLSIAILPEKCRIVYKMSREDGKTHKQIAEELNISEKTVNNHLVKALKDLSSGLTLMLPAFIVSQVMQDFISKS